MMKWRFYLDGRIEPVYGFAAVNASCISLHSRHHAYWRFDFDIDGPANDVVTEGPAPGRGRSRSASPDRDPADRGDARGQPAGDRLVGGGFRHAPRLPDRAGDRDGASGRHVLGRRLLAPEVQVQRDRRRGPVRARAAPSTSTASSTGRAWPRTSSFWYRGGALHPAGELDDCHVTGPTLYPVGDWSP